MKILYEHMLNNKFYDIFINKIDNIRKNDVKYFTN